MQVYGCAGAASTPPRCALFALAAVSCAAASPVIKTEASGERLISRRLPHTLLGVRSSACCRPRNSICSRGGKMVSKLQSIFYSFAAARRGYLLKAQCCARHEMHASQLQGTDQDRQGLCPQWEHMFAALQVMVAPVGMPYLCAEVKGGIPKPTRCRLDGDIASNRHYIHPRPFFRAQAARRGEGRQRSQAIY